MRRNSVFASTMLQHYSLFCADNSWHATRLQYNYTVRLRHGTLINMTLPFPCTRRIMIRTRMRSNIKLICKYPKIRRILRCESPYFHQCCLHFQPCWLESQVLCIWVQVRSVQVLKNVLESDSLIQLDSSTTLLYKCTHILILYSCGLLWTLFKQVKKWYGELRAKIAKASYHADEL